MVNHSIIETAERFTKLIPAEWDVKKAYLFGSYAKGNESEASDIDIAIVLGNMPDFFDAQIQLMRLRRKVDLRIEPHPISENEFSATNPYALEIQKTGIVISLISNSQFAIEPKAEYKTK